jgi:hypothetical protein
VSTETAELLQTMARDLANVEREIEQLKASQQQLASDNEKAIEQIKASQEQAAPTMRGTSNSSKRVKSRWHNLSLGLQNKTLG